MVRADEAARPWFLHRTHSGDEGRTWSAPEPLEILGQCPSLLRLSSGSLLLGYRQADERRAPGCSLSASRDQTWEFVADIYTAPKGKRDCAYPSMALLQNGRVFCAYYTAFQAGNCDIEGIVFEIQE